MFNNVKVKMKMIIFWVLIMITGIGISVLAIGEQVKHNDASIH